MPKNDKPDTPKDGLNNPSIAVELNTPGADFGRIVARAITEELQRMGLLPPVQVIGNDQSNIGKRVDFKGEQFNVAGEIGEYSLLYQKNRPYFKYRSAGRTQVISDDLEMIKEQPIELEKIKVRKGDVTVDRYIIKGRPEDGVYTRHTQTIQSVRGPRTVEWIVPDSEIEIGKTAQLKASTEASSTPRATRASLKNGDQVRYRGEDFKVAGEVGELKALHQSYRPASASRREGEYRKVDEDILRREYKKIELKTDRGSVTRYMKVKNGQDGQSAGLDYEIGVLKRIYSNDGRSFVVPDHEFELADVKQVRLAGDTSNGKGPPKVGAEIKHQNEPFTVSGYAGDQAVLHQKGRRGDEARIHRIISEAHPLSLYEKIKVNLDGNETVRYMKGGEVYRLAEDGKSIALDNEFITVKVSELASNETPSQGKEQEHVIRLIKPQDRSDTQAQEAADRRQGPEHAKYGPMEERVRTIDGTEVKVRMPAKASVAEFYREFEINGKKIGLKRIDDSKWFSSRDKLFDADERVKLHVTTVGAEDLAKLQKELLPYLDEMQSKGEIVAYKTFDPNFMDADWAKHPRKVGSGPSAKGQDSKGFTIYVTPEKAEAAAKAIDKYLAEKNLHLPETVKAGTVGDLTREKTATRRVSIERAIWPLTTTSDGQTKGALLDTVISKALQRKYEEHGTDKDGRLSTEVLRKIEKDAGIRAGQLRYDVDGKLMFVCGRTPYTENVDGYYADESGAVKKGEGPMTGRPALYALYEMAGLDPAQVHLHGEGAEMQSSDLQKSTSDKVLHPLVQLDLQELARKGVSADKLGTTTKMVIDSAKKERIPGVAADVAPQHAHELATILLAEGLEPNTTNIAKAQQLLKEIQQVRKEYPDSAVPITHALELLKLIAKNNDLFKQSFGNREFITATAEALSERLLKPGAAFEGEKNAKKKAEILQKALLDVFKDQLNLSQDDVPRLLQQMKIEAVPGTATTVTNGKDGPVIQIPESLLTSDPAAALREAFAHASTVAMIGVLGLSGNLRYVQQALKPIVEMIVATAEPNIRAKQAELQKKAEKPTAMAASEKRVDTIAKREPITVSWEGGDTIVWGKDQKLNLQKEAEQLKKQKDHQLAELKEELVELEKQEERPANQIKAMKEAIAQIEQDVAVIRNLAEALEAKDNPKLQEKARSLVKDAINKSLLGADDSSHVAKPGGLNRTTAITLLLMTLATTFAAKYGMSGSRQRYSNSLSGA